MPVIDQDKMNQLRANALENELNKPTEIELSNDAMITEVDAQANAVLYSGESTKKKKNPTLVIILLTVMVIAAVTIFLLKNAPNRPDINICKTHCCDGTCSPSEGQGACSYHGGICPQ